MVNEDYSLVTYDFVVGQSTCGSVTSSGIPPCQTYYYFVTAVDSNGVESADSNQVSAAIP